MNNSGGCDGRDGIEGDEEGERQGRKVWVLLWVTTHFSVSDDLNRERKYLQLQGLAGKGKAKANGWMLKPDKFQLRIQGCRLFFKKNTVFQLFKLL